MKFRTVVLSLTFLLSGSCFASETLIGQAIEKNGMEVGAVYLQPVSMACMAGTNDKTKYDIHLEADIHALKNNPNGFAYGAWIPYLTVAYHIVKEKSDWEKTSTLIPMVANDGPHYGQNVKLDGPGKYRVTFHIEPSSVVGFCHHTDKETGVADWWKAFDASWEFTYLGTGKSGGY